MEVKPLISLSFYYVPILILLFNSAATHVAAECTCEAEDTDHDPNDVTLRYKISGIFVIILAGALGVSLPILGKRNPSLQPGSSVFYMIKAFAAGVILSTGYIHVLPEAFEALTSPCLSENPWGKYPFTGLAAMVGSLFTLMIDSFGTGHFTRTYKQKSGGGGGGGGQPSLEEAKEVVAAAAQHEHGHGHFHGHGHHGSHVEGDSDMDRVLELGIIVHSVIIGISLGTSQSVSTIKPLMAALCFHQCFEGMGLGGCIAHADFKLGSTWIMGLLFSLTTPVGVAVGIGIMKTYDGNSPTALIIQGLLNSCAAGILIYMALVDLLAQDFMSPKLQANKRLFLASNLSLFLGAGFMAVLAIWA